MSPYIVFYFSLLSFEILLFFYPLSEEFLKEFAFKWFIILQSGGNFCHPTYWNWFARPHIHIYIFLCIFIDTSQSDCLPVFRLLVVIIQSTQNLLKKCLQTWYLIFESSYGCKAFKFWYVGSMNWRLILSFKCCNVRTVTRVIKYRQTKMSFSTSLLEHHCL